MTAKRGFSQTRPDCTAVVDEFARRMKGIDVGSLQTARQMLQSRLGKATGQPCDDERIEFLDHEINNRLTVHNLKMGLRELDLRPPVRRSS